jgi:hypothetical protein
MSGEEEASGMSEEEEELPPTSPPSRPSRRRSGVAVARAFHLVTRGRRSGAARGRSKPPIAVLGMPLHELRALANHR